MKSAGFEILLYRQMQNFPLIIATRAISLRFTKEHPLRHWYYPETLAHLYTETNAINKGEVENPKP